MTPTALRSCIRRSRRCTSRRWLRGKNLAAPVGFFLQSLLESLACPFTSLRLHFQLNLSQRLRTCLFVLHRLPFVVVRVMPDEEPFTPRLWGQCQDAPSN